MAVAERREAEAARALRLRDLPSARSLDLVTERLPPGIPERVLTTQGPALWWTAPSGAGRTLAGLWLRARGRAAFVSGETWSSVRDRIPEGPAFVELTSREPSATPPARPHLCVAAPFAPATEWGFERVATPSLRDTLPLLLAWAEERLPADSRFRAALFEPALVEHVANHTLDTIGAVIGVIGVIDELAVRDAKQLSLERLARRFVERRLAQSLVPSAPHAGWLRRALYPTLLGMFERVLLDADGALEVARTFDAWQALVPPEVERAVDVDWMRLSLAELDRTIRPSDVERAAQRLPPGAYRIVSSLERSRLLLRDDTDRLRLSPVWLRDVLRQRAIDGLVERSPFEWGEALLRPHTAALVAQALLARTLSVGGSVLEPVLDLEAEDQPAYAAALDLCFRAAGVARLLGAEIGSEVIDGLWSEMERLALVFPDGTPLPRIELITDDAGEPGSATEQGAALLRAGTFHLAALSLSEALARKPGRLMPLAPWLASEPHPSLVEAYDAIWRSLDAASVWRAATFSLIERVKRAIGRVGGPDAVHPLERPAEIVDEIQHAVLTFETLGGSTHAEWLEPTLALAEQRGLSLADVARALWHAWDEAGRPDHADFLAPSAARRAVFWAHIPGPLLEGLLADARRQHVPYELFGAEQWRAFAGATLRTSDLAHDPRAWELMPAEVALQLFGSPLHWDAAPLAVRVLWARFPDLLQAAVKRALEPGSRGDARSLEVLLASAPAAEASALVQELLSGEPGRGVDASALAPLRRLLHRLIRERSPEWREAYRALSEIERELRRVATAASDYAPGRDTRSPHLRD